MLTVLAAGVESTVASLSSRHTLGAVDHHRERGDVERRPRGVISVGQFGGRRVTGPSPSKWLSTAVRIALVPVSGYTVPVAVAINLASPMGKVDVEPVIVPDAEREQLVPAAIVRGADVHQRAEPVVRGLVAAHNELRRGCGHDRHRARPLQDVRVAFTTTSTTTSSRLTEMACTQWFPGVTVTGRNGSFGVSLTSVPSGPGGRPDVVLDARELSTRGSGANVGHGTMRVFVVLSPLRGSDGDDGDAAPGVFTGCPRLGTTRDGASNGYTKVA